MQKAVIHAERLCLTYRTPVRKERVRDAIAAIFRPEYRTIEAVRALDLRAEAGELVGVIGPNGAGKTSLVKLLCGILYPTSGSVRVLGHIPVRREYAFLRQIALIRGSRPVSEAGDLTPMDLLRFQQRMYELSEARFRGQLALLGDLLDLMPLAGRQLRTLSLGEKMRVGLANSLIYGPRVICFDEPTIGVDVAYIGRIRRFIADYVASTRSTVLLTSHNMGDIESLCRRVVLLRAGTKAYDGPREALAEKIDPTRLIAVRAPAPIPPLPDSLRLLCEERAPDGHSACLRLAPDRVNEAVRALLDLIPGCELKIEAPDFERVVEKIYREDGL